MKKRTLLIISSLHSRMKRNTLQNRTGIKNAILFFFVTLLLSGCHSYFKISSLANPSTEKINALDRAGKNLIAHFGSEKWVLTGTAIKNDTIYGSLQDYNRLPALKPIQYKKPNRYKSGKMHDQRFLLNEVHLYLDKPFEGGKKQIAIPVNTIEQADIYDKDQAATSRSLTSTMVGITLGVAAIATGLYYLYFGMIDQ